MPTPRGLGVPPEMPDTRTKPETSAQYIGSSPIPQTPGMSLEDDTSQPDASRKSRAPGRKFLAAGTGLGLGGNISIIVAYHFPDMPATVTAAYGALVMYLVTLLITYLVPSE